MQPAPAISNAVAGLVAGHVTGLVIRPAIPADFDIITAIYADEVRNRTATFELEPPDTAEMRWRFDSLIANGFPYLTAVLDGDVVGYAYAGPYRTRPAFRFTVENSIYLAPAAQGRGIGGALLQALMDDCTARGFKQMVAVIGDSANHASVRLHARAGFELIGTQPAIGYKFERWLDIVIMQRALPEQA